VNQLQLYVCLASFYGRAAAYGLVLAFLSFDRAVVVEHASTVLQRVIDTGSYHIPPLETARILVLALRPEQDSGLRTAMVSILKIVFKQGTGTTGDPSQATLADLISREPDVVNLCLRWIRRDVRDALHHSVPGHKQQPLGQHRLLLVELICSFAHNRPYAPGRNRQGGQGCF
jgi:hypothetical protein